MGHSLRRRVGGRAHLAVTVVLLATAVVLGAEGPVKPPATAPAAPAAPAIKRGPNGEALYSNLFTDADIRQALADLATQTGVIVVPDETVQGLVSIELKDVPVETALDLLVLSGGFVWDKMREGVYLVAKPDPKSSGFPRMSRVRVVPLKYLVGKSLADILPPIYQTMVKVDDAGGRAIITAPSRMLDDIANFIAQVDSPGQAVAPPPVQPSLRAVDLKYLTVGQLQALLPPAAKASISGATDATTAFVSGIDKQLDDTMALVKVLDTGRDELRVVELANTTGREIKAMLPESLKTHVAADDDGNRAVVSASPREVEAMATALREIDAHVTHLSPANVLQTTVHLDYIDSALLMKLLPKGYVALIRGDETMRSRPQDQHSSNQPASSSVGPSAPAPLAESSTPAATDTPDLGTTVFVSGTPEQMKDVLAAIKALDRPPVQVMLEALVVEASREDMNQFSVSAQDRHFGVDTVAGTVAYGSPASALLHKVLWLVQHQRAKIKASPRVIAQDGKEANVRLSVNQYFSIISGPTTNPYVTLQAIEAAIGLTMTPRVATADKMVTCTLQPEVGDVSGTGANALPIITRRTASTTVRVADGQVIAVGGLLQEFEARTRNKIPILGDLPLIGKLFQSTKTDMSQREITIFVVPHILDEEGVFKGPLLFDRISPSEPPVAAVGTRPAAQPAPVRVPPKTF